MDFASSFYPQFVGRLPDHLCHEASVTAAVEVDTDSFACFEGADYPAFQDIARTDRLRMTFK